MSARHVQPRCKHCKRAIIRCEARPEHAGCSSSRGYLHAGSGRHFCASGDPRNCAEPAGALAVAR